MSNPIQASLFDLPEAEETPEPAPAQAPIAGTTTWRRVGRKVDCVDCWQQQATDHAAGRQVTRRERAKVEMRSGSDVVELCDRHARDRGWRGRS